MQWGSDLDVHPVSPISTFLHTFFAHFHHIYSVSRLIDMVIHFEGACYKTSYFPPHFSGPPSPWISKLGIGCSTPAPMACDLLPRLLGRLKNTPPLGILPRWVESGESAMQDGVHLLCHKKYSTFGILVFSPCMSMRTHTNSMLQSAT